MSIKGMIKEIMSYTCSKVLQLAFKVRFAIKGSLPEGKVDIVNSFDWGHNCPGSYVNDPKQLTDYHIRSRGYGRFEGKFKVRWNGKNDPLQNSAFWLLQLEKDKVQEIDIFETMTVKGVNRIYFSIYNNEESNMYYDPITEERIYDRFQVRMGGKKLMKYLASHVIDYAVEWSKDKVVWYVGGIPVAVSWVYVPTQELHTIINNYDED